MPTPADRRTLDLAARLAQLAANVHAAKDHIAREHANTDGIAAASINDGSRSTDGTSTVERTMLARLHLANQSAQINDDLDAIDNIIRSCTQTCTKAIGTRAPVVHATCYADPGLDGYLIPISDGGWHDATCTDLARSATGGLCDRHRKAAERWRERNDKKPLTDERDIHVDTKIVAGQLGVIHAYPINQVA